MRYAGDYPGRKRRHRQEDHRGEYAVEHSLEKSPYVGKGVAGHFPEDEKRVFLPGPRLGDREAEKRGFRASRDCERFYGAGVAVYHGVLDDYVFCRHRDSGKLPVRFRKRFGKAGGVCDVYLAVDETRFLGKLRDPTWIVGV